MEATEVFPVRASHLWFRLCFFLSVTWDNIWDDDPPSTVRFKQSHQLSVSFLLLTPTLFTSYSLGLLTHTHTDAQTEQHTTQYNTTQRVHRHTEPSALLHTKTTVRAVSRQSFSHEQTSSLFMTGSVIVCMFLNVLYARQFQ